MNKPGQITAVISRKEQFSEKVFLFTFQMENPQHFSFTPGQFVSVDVGGTRRSYSIASTPSQKTHFDLLVDIGPGGPGSAFFSKSQEGDMIHAIGPMGNFSLTSEEGMIVFLAAGTGIAPFKSMIDTLFEKQIVTGDSQHRQIYLYFGFRFEKDIFWDEYFKTSRQRHRNFHYALSLSKPTPAWQGKSGHVQAGIESVVLHDPTAHFYICGGGAMVKGVTEFLRARSVSENHIHFEPF